MMRLLFVFFLFNFATSTEAQLNGTYTVGSIGDDYPNSYDAFTALQTLGMNGSVEFVISPGNYGLLFISNVNVPSGEHLLIRSAENNPNTVLFEAGEVIQTDSVILSGISFSRPNDGSVNSVLDIYHASCRVHKCRIIDQYNTTIITPEATLKIDHGSTGTNNVYIDSCFIYSIEGLNSLSPSNSTVIQRGGDGGAFFHADTIWGGWDTWTSNYRELKKCELYLDDGLDEYGTALIDSCSISFYPYLNAGQIQTTTLSNSTINCSGIVALSTTTTHNCHFVCKTDLSMGNNCIHSNNIMEQYCHINQSNNAKIVSNVFKDKLVFQGYLDAYFVNNFFQDTLRIQGENGIYFYNNNFADSAYLISQIWGGGFVNNNFMDVQMENVELLEISHNNYSGHGMYMPFYSYFDSSPTYYDPNFTSVTDNHINNPALYSLATNLTYPETFLDVDDEVRELPWSIGADEAWLQLPLVDTIKLVCGSDYPLKLPDSLASIYHWEPAILLIDSSLSVPTIHVDTINRLWLVDSLGNVIDSILFMPYTFPSTSRTLYGYCGFDYKLATYAQGDAPISWQPIGDLDDPTAHIVTANVDSTTQFVVTIDLGVCGIRYDSILFVMDQGVYANIMIDSGDCYSLKFETNSYCYDSLTWNLGDGSFVTDDLSFWHTYSDTGLVNISLIVWNHGISATDSLQLVIGCLEDLELDASSILVYPNPTNSQLIVEWPSQEGGISYQLIDQLGRIIETGYWNPTMNNLTQQQLSLEKYSAGTYFLELNENIQTVMKLPSH